MILPIVQPHNYFISCKYMMKGLNFDQMDALANDVLVRNSGNNNLLQKFRKFNPRLHIGQGSFERKHFFCCRMWKGKFPRKE